MPDDSLDRPETPDPPDHDRLRSLVRHSLVAEFATARGGRPAAYPVVPLYDDETGRLVVHSPPAYAGKVEDAKADPKVALLLADGDGEYLVAGDASVRDADPEANAEYVNDLGMAEPEGHRRAVLEATAEFLQSWIGRRVMGWYALRLVVEIEPTSVRRVADPTAVERIPAWDAVGVDATEARRYDRALLAVADGDGYPAIRPLAGIEPRNGEAVVEPGPAVPVPDGQPACLLCHWHDDRAENLGQRLVRGRLRTRDDVPVFAPGSSFELSVDGLLDKVRFVLDGRRRTKAYFRDRD